MKGWFSYDAEGDGFRLHDAEEEARTAAQRALEQRRDEAADGWSEDVESICWGKVHQAVVLTSSIDTADDPDCSSRFDSIDDYDLLDVDEKPTGQ